MLPRSISACSDAAAQYIRLFGDGPAEVFSAPGRTEIIGNHTDHQHGCAVAASVSADMIAVVGRTDTSDAAVFSEGHGMIQADLDDLSAKPEEKGTSAALVRGVAAGIRRRLARKDEAGSRELPALTGFNAYITSDVPSGLGMSSSAALEVLLGCIFSEGSVSLRDIAVIGMRAENDYFGKPSGLLDQMACSGGGAVFMDFADPENPAVKKVALDPARFGYEICLVDTGGSHADLTDAYAAVPEEMRRIASFFGWKVLRDVPEKDFLSAVPVLRKEAGDRAVLRAMHFFDENRRVQEAANALEESDFEGFLRLVRESGASSFQLLQNVCPEGVSAEQNIALALAMSGKILQGRGASRVHGGGFAGTIQAYVPRELLEEYRQRMENVFGEKTVYAVKIRPAGGVCVTRKCFL